MVSIKGQPDIVYEICDDGYDNYIPTELNWENYRRLIDGDYIIYTDPSQLIMVKEKIPHIPTPWDYMYEVL